MNNTNGNGQIRNVDGENIPLLNFVYVVMSVSKYYSTKREKSI